MSDKPWEQDPNEEIDNEDIDSWIEDLQNQHDVLKATQRFRRLQTEISDQKEITKAALKELELARKRVEAALSLTSDREPLVIEKKITQEPTRQAISISLASDWHVEEGVDAVTVNFLNHYDLDESAARAAQFFRGVEWMLDSKSPQFYIDTHILWLGGDMITGYIHEEFKETNLLSPPRATRRCQKYLIGGIKYLLEHGKFNKLVVICNFGNHGRTNPARIIATQADNSFEWMMFHSIKDHFESIGEDRVKVVVPESALVYAHLYDWTVRFHHGDFVRYQGGVGGISIPFRKKVDSWNQSKHADLTVIGHYHQLREYGDMVVNGSLIGWNPFAISLGARFEHPRQGFFLMDWSRGFTNWSPIYVTDSGRMVSQRNTAVASNELEIGGGNEGS